MEVAEPGNYLEFFELKWQEGKWWMFILNLLIVSRTYYLLHAVPEKV